jgi:DNA-binding transcriptional MerR regulator
VTGDGDVVVIAAPVEDEGPDDAPRRSGKSETAFRTISEVSEDLDIPQHVLRFWESKFTQIRPLKRGGGRRYYRPEDLAVLRRIRDLLYREGYTIRGVQKLLRDPVAGRAVVADNAAETLPLLDDLIHESPPREEQAAEITQDERDAAHHLTLTGILDELVLLRNLLNQARSPQ